MIALRVGPRRCVVATYALVLTLPSVAFGAAERDVTLPPVVVTGSRLPQSETPVPQAVIVIPERDIRTRAPARFPDLLRGTSTLHVDQPGAPGGFSSLYLRGADPSHTAILIDGVKVSDPTNPRGGGIDLSLIDPRTVERVEILPGASSGIYGADAIAGVVNIITREPQNTGARIDAGFGGDGYRIGSVNGSVRAGAVGLHAHAASTRDGHTSDDAFTRLRTGSLKLTAGDRGRQHLNAFLRVQHQESGAFPEDSGGSIFAVRRQLERRHTDAAVAGINGETPTSWGSVRMFANLFDQDTDIASPGVAPGVRDPFGLPRTTSDSRYRRWAIGAIATVGAAADTSGLLGVQYEKEQGEVASTLFFGPFARPADFTLERQTRSVFGETRVQVSNRVSLHGGARADVTQAHGTRTTFRGGLRYRPSDTGPWVALNYGTGFKPPSFFALGHPIVGNPQLRPEESRTLEASVASPDENSFAPLRYRAAVFRSRYGDLVDFEAGPPPRLVNRSAVTVSGYEISVAARVAEPLDLRVQVTGLTFDLPEGVPALRNRPRFRATAGAGFILAPELTGSVTASYVGRTFDSSVPTGGVFLGSYVHVDAALRYELRSAQLVFAVDNLLDREYQQFVGFPARGRRVRVELSLNI